MRGERAEGFPFLKVNETNVLKKLSLIAVAAALFVTPALAAPDWQGVDKALRRTGVAQPDGVHRYSFPRSDLNVTLDGVRLKPALALGSWAAFQPMGEDTMVMGDLVLTHDEINPVMTSLLAAGYAITALHNHLLRSAPATMYMHIDAHGDPLKLAQGLHDALAHSPRRWLRPRRSARLRRSTSIPQHSID